MKKIYYFTNIAPHYRKEIWFLLSEEQSWRFNFVFGDNFSSNPIIPLNIKANSMESKCHKVRNIAWKNVLIWQVGVIGLCLSKSMDIAIFLGDMHILTNWLASLICRVRGIKVLYWGHGFSGKEGFLKKFFRTWFNSLAHEHLLYGQRGKNIMVGLGFIPSKLHVISNSLAYSEHFKLRSSFQHTKKEKVFHFFKNPDLPTLLFIGRLTPSKEIYLLIEALYNLNAESLKYNLLIIGEGEEEEKLKELGYKAIEDKSLHFYGRSYNEKENSILIAHADLCVSPGNIGLTVIHCLSYGTPSATHNNFANQMPEYEAITPFETGFFFKENDLEDICEKIKGWFDSNTLKREEIRRKCYSKVDNYYNPEKQMDIFKKVLV